MLKVVLSIACLLVFKSVRRFVRVLIYDPLEIVLGAMILEPFHSVDRLYASNRRVGVVLALLVIIAVGAGMVTSTLYGPNRYHRDPCLFLLGLFPTCYILFASPGLLLIGALSKGGAYRAYVAGLLIFAYVSLFTWLCCPGLWLVASISALRPYFDLVATIVLLAVLGLVQTALISPIARNARMYGVGLHCWYMAALAISWVLMAPIHLCMHYTAVDIANWELWQRSEYERMGLDYEAPGDYY